MTGLLTSVNGQCHGFLRTELAGHCSEKCRLHRHQRAAASQRWLPLPMGRSRRRQAAASALSDWEST